MQQRAWLPRCSCTSLSLHRRNRRNSLRTCRLHSIISLPKPLNLSKPHNLLSLPNLPNTLLSKGPDLVDLHPLPHRDGSHCLSHTTGSTGTRHHRGSSTTTTVPTSGRLVAGLTAGVATGRTGAGGASGLV